MVSRHLRRAVLRATTATLLGAATTVTPGVLSPPAATAADPQYSNTPVASWRPQGVGYATLVVGNTVYVGGSFTSVTSPNGSISVARANLVAFDIRSGALLTTFRADTNGTVRALAYDGTNLFVGGAFSSVNGTSRGRVAALDPTTGSVRTDWTANANSTVYALATAPGRLYAAGSFTTIKGVSRTRAAALSLADGTPAPFNPRPDATVLSVATSPDGTAVYLGGDFAKVAGVTQPYIAKVNGGGGLVSMAWKSINGSVLALDVTADGTRVAAGIGGDGLVYPIGTNEVAVLDPVTGREYWSQQCEGDGQAVHVVGGSVFAGFHEGCQGDMSIRVTRNDIATGARSTAFRPSFDLFWGVRAISSGSGALVVGGDFTKVSGVPVRGFAIFPDVNADATAPTTPTSLTTSNVTSDGVGLTWNAATDNVAVTGYRLVRNGTVLPGTISGLSTTDSGLSPDTTYTYTVRAVDAAGNTSADSNQVTVTTSAADASSLYGYDWSAGDSAPWPGQWTTTQSSGVLDHQAGSGRMGFSDVSGAYARAQLSGLAPRADMDVTFTYQWGKTGSGAWFDISLRGSGGWANAYRPRTAYYLEASGGSGTVYLNKTVNGSVTPLTSVSGAQGVSTAKQHVHFRVSGSTVQFRTWPDGSAEPSTWAATVTDSSITTDGQLFLALARSSANVGTRDLLLDDLKVTAP